MGHDEDRVKTSLFANELMELYHIVQAILRSDPDRELYQQIACCLPEEQMKYFYMNIDMQHSFSERENGGQEMVWDDGVKIIP